ncbi:MAG: MerR family transcriptional regulator [Phycisphaerales bacterium]|nr:MAG: MerR family transcriptional regulator [Phycisphaerales bacterium]
MKNSTLQIPAKLYRIGELVRYTPFSRQTIHNYTIMGLISEAQWTEGGHRLYDESVFERLSTILRLKETKTLSEIREILRKENAHAKASPFVNAGSFARRKAKSVSIGTKPAAKRRRPTSDES